MAREVDLGGRNRWGQGNVEKAPSGKLKPDGGVQVQ